MRGQAVRPQTQGRCVPGDAVDRLLCMDGDPDAPRLRSGGSQLGDERRAICSGMRDAPFGARQGAIVVENRHEQAQRRRWSFDAHQVLREAERHRRLVRFHVQCIGKFTGQGEVVGLLWSGRQMQGSFFC